MKTIIFIAIFFHSLICLAVNTVSEIASTHPNGQKKSEIIYEIQDSTYYPIQTVRFDSTGFTIDVKTYKDSLLHGNCINYRNGSLYTNIPYKKGKIHGSMEVFYPTGQLNFSIKYHDGIKHGKVKVYYEDGTLHKYFSFKNGVQHGKYTGYYPNGEIEISGKRKYKNPTGKFVKFFLNGQIEEKGKYKYYKKSGIWLKYNTDGNLLEYNYHNKHKPKIRSFIYYPDKTIKAEGFYIGDQRVGIWHTFFKSGEIREVAVYDSIVTDNPFSVCKEYWEGTTKIRFTGFRNNEALDSLWVEYDSLGVKLVEQNYFNGELSGLSTTFYSDGSISKQGIYVKNKKNGIWRNFDENGALVDEIHHKAKINPTNGENRNYFDSGVLKTRMLYQGGQVGIIYSYFEDGSTRRIDDTIHNSRKEFYPNGQLKYDEYLAVFNKGFSRSTLLKTYHINGNLRTEIRYNQPGHFRRLKFKKEYFKSGKIKSYEYKDKEILYFENGYIKESSEIKGNKKNGLFQRFYEKTGTHKYSCYYLDDKQHGIAKEYFPEGTIKSESYYNKGKQEGIYQSYYKNGQLRFMMEYINGKKEGQCIKYYYNGVVEYISNYTQNRKTGVTFFYDENGNVIKTENFDNKQN